MNNVVFDNLQEYVITSLKSAQVDVVVAVAWINFGIYGDVLVELANRGVKIRIVINDDFINARQDKRINLLEQKGVVIRKFKMPNTRQYMHEKFCVIDKRLVVFGSFNWSQNANVKNFENLAISDDLQMVYGFLNEFEMLWNIPMQNVSYLQNPDKCDKCGAPILNIGVLSQEGYYQTKFEYYSVCDCSISFENNDFFDISVYNNLMGIFDSISGREEDAYTYGYEYSEELRNKDLIELNFQIQNYLAIIRNAKTSVPIIHALGIRAVEMQYPDYEDRYIKILWKERYVSQYIDDSYPIENGF